MKIKKVETNTEALREDKIPHRRRLRPVGIRREGSSENKEVPRTALKITE